MNYDDRADYILEALGKELARSASEYITTPVAKAYSGEIPPLPSESAVQSEEKERTCGKVLPFHKRPFLLSLRRGLVAVLIAAVCLTGFVPEVRAALIRGINYVIEVFRDHVTISSGSSPDVLPADEAWNPAYELSWIPDNYALIYEDKTSSWYDQVYESDAVKDSSFRWSQTDSRTYSTSVDNEHLTHEIIEVNYCEAHLFYELYPDVPDEPESLCHGVILIWQDGGTTLELNAMNMSREEILRIAEGVQKKQGT